MARAEPVLKSIYIVAVGGQGSVVLADWLFNAAHGAGYAAQTVGLPGLSQRGGSTSFYVEVLLSRDTAEQERVVFSHYPVPGQVDIILAQEFLELGRALQRGFASPGTAVVASTHRVYSLAEKMPASGGPASDDDIYRLVEGLAGPFTGFDALALARASGLDEVAVNAILLGALSATGLLPIEEEAYRQAIHQTGVAVEANLKAFDLGRKPAARPSAPAAEPTRFRDDRIQELSARLPARRRRGFISLCTSEVTGFDPQVQDILIEACYVLADYQDLPYAAGFLGRVGEIYAADSEGHGFELSRLFAAGLASLMSYEDVIQVARYKSSQHRFSTIREGMGIGRGQVYRVADYFSPEVDEILSVLPSALYRPRAAVLRWLGWGGAVLRYRSPTTSLPGFVLLRLLGGMRRWRRRSRRYRQEAGLWQDYQEAVAEFARLDYGLGCLAARCAQMVKGYGAIRRRHVEAVRIFVEEMLRPLVDRELALDGGNFPLTLKVGHLARDLILGGEDGVERAREMVAGVLRDLQGKESYPAVLERVSSTPAAAR
ncbi:MAG: indolepyruvate oxidoreductase subunit beta family protein [Dehalococcoidia bacterium]